MYGERALAYFGEDAVAYFVDNDERKAGTFVCGKEIVTFRDLLNRKDDYQIVISIAKVKRIEQQLRENGIENYMIYTPAAERAKEKIIEYLEQNKTKNIVLFGVDRTMAVMLKEFENLRQWKNLRGICDFSGGAFLGMKLGGYTVSEFADYQEECDCAIVFTQLNHAAARTYLKAQGISVIDPYVTRFYETDEIVANPYRGGADDVPEEEWNETRVDNNLITAVDYYAEVANKYTPLFQYIEIETINRCNGVCSFCPVNCRVDPRTRTLMDMELFHKIIDELAGLNYEGSLCTFSNNEPLLDKRIVELNRYARKKLPKARMHLFTNGTLLTVELFLQLIEYLDELIIDNYNQELKLIEINKVIAEYVEKHPELKKKVTIVLRKQNEILTSRGGDAPNRENIVSFPGHRCALPFEQMVIRPDGKVSLCCNDPLGKNTLGDASKESLLEIWFGEKYKRVSDREIYMKGIDHSYYYEGYSAFMVKDIDGNF